MIAEARPSIVQSKGVQQLIKFCIVGASSTVVDVGGLYLLTGRFGTHFWVMLQAVTFSLGVTNGFFWNRLWTFEIKEKASARHQYIKFFAANIIGFALNIFFTKVFLHLFQQPVPPPHNMLIFCKLMAIPIVVIWNFTASKLWTFK